jgi:hypothetical protein
VGGYLSRGHSPEDTSSLADSNPEVHRVLPHFYPLPLPLASALHSEPTVDENIFEGRARHHKPCCGSKNPQPYDPATQCCETGAIVNKLPMPEDVTQCLNRTQREGYTPTDSIPNCTGALDNPMQLFYAEQCGSIGQAPTRTENHRRIRANLVLKRY